jgi:hypothetical protein
MSNGGVMNGDSFSRERDRAKSNQIQKISNRGAHGLAKRKIIE